MKIRTSLTIKTTGVIAIVFLFCLIIIYLMSEHNREETFYRTLQSEAITQANTYLTDRADASTLQQIYENNRQLVDEVQVAIYSVNPDKLLYHDSDSLDYIKETPQMLHKIDKEGYIKFRNGLMQCIGIKYNFHNKDYILTAAASDTAGRDYLTRLANMLAGMYVASLAIWFFISWLLSRNALSPINHLTEEAISITVGNLTKRLPIKDPNNEIGEMSSAFNDLLDRLTSAISAQKAIVSNISHEMRTPLTAITAQLDIALMKDRTPEEYRRAISLVLDDAHRMTQLMASLTNLAKADYDPQSIKMEPIRVDELLIDTRELLLKSNPDYHIDLAFDPMDDETAIEPMVTGNSFLLGIAISNLIDNNCKYSPDHTASIQLHVNQHNLTISFSDAGNGMTPEDCAHIFDLFYRGKDAAEKANGHGIGMALVKKVISHHDGDIQVHSSIGQGTTFTVTLPLDI